MKRTAMPPRAVPLPRSTIGRNQGPRRPAKHPKDTGPAKGTVIAVLERDGYACVKCGGVAHGQRGVDYSIHHRRLRAQGVDNSLPNLVTLCGDGTRGCHGWAHHNRAAAEAEGLIVRSGFDLLQVPIFHHAYGQVFLRSVADPRTARGGPMTMFDVDRAARQVEAAALRAITAHHYYRDEDPHSDAEAEHADELLALASRDLVRAVEALPENERPIGWGTTEVTVR